MKWLLMVFKIGNDVQQKGWYASKTIWFNILSLIAAIAALKGLNLDAQDVATIAAAASTLGNIWLRARTSTPIGARTIPGADVPTGNQPAGDTGIKQPEPAERPFESTSIMG